MAEGSELIKAAGEMEVTGEGFNWKGMNPAQMRGVAQAMAMSGMFPDIAKDSAKAFVKIMAGQEMGIAPFQAMSDISIIGGKAAPGGNIHASKVKSSGRYDYKVKKWDREGCAIEFFEVMRSGKRESLGVSEFLKQDAQDAQLLAKENWKKYPRNMYFNRAMTAGVRTYCPDVLGGVNAYTPEELGATVDEEGRVIKMPSAIDGEVVNTPPAETKPQKSTITLIGEELASKGFESKLDRQKIAFNLAGVDSLDGTDEDGWQEVLAHVRTTSTEKLAGIISQPLPPEEEDDTPPPDDSEPAPEVSDDELNNLDHSLDDVADAPAPLPYVLPEFKKGNTPIPRPAMVTLFNKWSKEFGLASKKEVEAFTKKVIDKNAAATFEDFHALLIVLSEELNARAARAKQERMV